MNIYHYSCTTPNHFNHYCEEIKQRFVSQGYQPQPINRHIKIVEKMKKERTFKRKRQHHLKRNKNSASINI